jgi:hypothetical protein
VVLGRSSHTLEARAILMDRYGLLHRIPRPATPPATVFSADGYFSTNVNSVSGRASIDSVVRNGENGEMERGGSASVGDSTPAAHA